MVRKPKRQHGTKTMYNYETVLVKQGKLARTCDLCREAKRVGTEVSNKARYRAYRRLAIEFPELFNSYYLEEYIRAEAEKIQRDATTAEVPDDGGKTRQT